MSKVTKKQLLKRLEALEQWSNWADNMLDELNHALPDPEYDAKCEAEAADVDASLDRHRERLGLNKPQLKQLDQSVFDGLNERWVAASVGENGIVRLYLSNENNPYDCEYHLAGTKYDTTDWQNSLIERDIAKELLEVDLSSELTGSDLCRAMLARGDKYVLCQCWDSSYADIEQVVDVINGFECTAYKKLFAGNRHNWEYATPINNQGEPLTASEAGL